MLFGYLVFTHVVVFDQKYFETMLHPGVVGKEEYFRIRISAFCRMLQAKIPVF